MEPQRIKILKASLNLLVEKYQAPKALALDPITIPLSFLDPWDRELAAWIAAHLAYGRVAPMQKAILKVLAPLGPSPSAWLRKTNAADIRTALNDALTGWVWRFHTSQDMIEWILAWKRLDTESQGHGLERHLLPGDHTSRLSQASPHASTPRNRPSTLADEALSALVQRLRRELPASHGTRFSLPDPLEGAACKRWRMFLRWMVRDEWPDMGKWRLYPTATLIIPLDTHVARTARLIGLSTRTTPDGRMAQEITDALKCIDPSDPLRFDFAISHLGILGDCPGARSLPDCAPCPLVSVCVAGVIKRKTPSPT